MINCNNQNVNCMQFATMNVVLNQCRCIWCRKCICFFCFCFAQFMQHCTPWTFTWGGTLWKRLHNSAHFKTCATLSTTVAVGNTATAIEYRLEKEREESVTSRGPKLWLWPSSIKRPLDRSQLKQLLSVARSPVTLAVTWTIRRGIIYWKIAMLFN